VPINGGILSFNGSGKPINTIAQFIDVATHFIEICGCRLLLLGKLGNVEGEGIDRCFGFIKARFLLLTGNVY
jgi:hypothetical protein